MDTRIIITAGWDGERATAIASEDGIETARAHGRTIGKAVAALAAMIEKAEAGGGR